MVANNHLTYFKVENFKNFASLEVKNIGQFNLIVGDNNVGKTCLLEALLFDEEPKQLISNFWMALKKRGMLFQIEEITKKVGNKSTTETIYPKENYFKKHIFGEFSSELRYEYIINDKKSGFKIKLADENKAMALLKNQNKHLEEITDVNVYNYNLKAEDFVKAKDFVKQHINVIKTGEKEEENLAKTWIYKYDEDYKKFPLISFSTNFYGEEIRELYGKIETKTEKEFLLNTLKVIAPTLTNIDFSSEFKDLKDVFLFSYSDQEALIPLNFSGDGFKRIFYIVLKALSLKSKRLMIDEIEIGIHYSKQKDSWAQIMKICKELDIQLFATTHSEECITAFMEASKEIEEKNLRLIRLQKNSDKSIKAICYPYNELEHIVTSHINER